MSCIPTMSVAIAAWLRYVEQDGAGSYVSQMYIGTSDVRTCGQLGHDASNDSDDNKQTSKHYVCINEIMLNAPSTFARR